MEGSWDTLAAEDTVLKTVESLKANGMNAIITTSVEDAKSKLFSLLPEGADVMTMTSVTLDALGIPDAIENSDKYVSVRKKIGALDPQVHMKEKQQLGSAPEYVIGSVHAVTEDGKVLVASNTGSQLPAYSYGSRHVIWVVGTQKIVKDVDEGMKRVYDYVLPLESERAKKAYGVEGSFVSKLLIFNKEVNPQRITILFVPEKLGF